MPIGTKIAQQQRSDYASQYQYYLWTRGSPSLGEHHNVPREHSDPGLPHVATVPGQLNRSVLLRVVCPASLEHNHRSTRLLIETAERST
ncbi:hypothetical protein RRG08_015901 [Elysia crispata]|uniref:Uncharacterized protein n=1 Tax=Elysia crispata TaxID=231223 RepID=A0AAE1AMB6_9GAST|nr:hypothetical protein RRG08_015901 [Elysia crispata]